MGCNGLSGSQVFKRYKAFSESRESIMDEPRSGRPSTSQTDINVQLVRAVVQSDRRRAMRMISSQRNVNHTTVRQILTEQLAMEKLCTKIVPQNMTITTTPLVTWPSL
jgi:hypothetical protein